MQGGESVANNNRPIQLQISKSIFNDKFYPLLFDYSHRWEVYKGSAGSGKSHFISQKLIIKCLNDSGRRVLICRKFGAQLMQSCGQLVIEQLRFFQISEQCDINKTLRTIEFPNGSQLIFIGLDDEEKLLSIQNISDIWLEEASQINRDLAEQCSLRMRGVKKNQQIFISFNPVSVSNWLYDFCEVNSPSSFYYHQSTYKDNKFLPIDYINSLEDLYRTNPVKARVFCDGEWGVDTEGLVFPNHKELDFDIDEMIRTTDFPIKVGVDLGYADPSTCVVSVWDKVNKKIYIIAEYYQRRASFEEVCQGIRYCGVSNKQKIYVDNADPRAIQYFKDQGLYALPCKKGKDSNKLYIMFLQNHEIIVHPSCKHVLEELDNFVYLKDKDGNYNEDKTDHTFSHTIDALKYAYGDVYKSKKLSSINLKIGL